MHERPEYASSGRLPSGESERATRQNFILTSLLTWWLWRGGCTRSHSELGRETPQRQWYFVLRRGRVGRCQVCRAVSLNIRNNFIRRALPNRAARSPRYNRPANAASAHAEAAFSVSMLAVAIEIRSLLQQSPISYVVDVSGLARRGSGSGRAAIDSDSRRPSPRSCRREGGSQWVQRRLHPGADAGGRPRGPGTCS